MHPLSKMNEAQELRRQGMSVREIASILGIARSTSSKWARGVVLGEDGAKRLAGRRRNISWDARTRAQQEKARNIRDDAYQSGLHSQPTVVDAMCVGLYWGEGNKSDSSWGMSNSDINVLRMMVGWAIRAGQPAGAFAMRVHVHPNDIVTDQEVREHWSQAGVPIQNVRVYRIRTPTSNLRTKGKTPFGTCQLTTIKNGVRLFQYIQGQQNCILRHIVP